MADLGTALAVLTDLPRRWSFVSGTTNLAYSIARRLIAERGSLDYDPNYGTDIRDFLNQAVTENGKSAIGAAITAECHKDERVSTVDVDVDYDQLTQVMKITVDGIAVTNVPFRLVLGVDKLNVNLLEAV